MSDVDIEKKWTTKAAKALIGKKIVKVQYMTKKNAGDLDWYQRPLMLKLDDGSLYSHKQMTRGMMEEHSMFIMIKIS